MIHDRHSDCDDWGELVSARLDHELTASEREAVEAHLATCEPCRQLVSTFEDIDDLVRTPINVDGGRVMALVADDAGHRCERPARGLRRLGSTFASAGTAAVLLLGFVGLVRWMQADPRGEVVRPVTYPLETLSTISHQQRRTQEMTREALQWELRTLKLELDQLQLTPDESRRLRGRLAELIRQLEFPSMDSPAKNRRESI